MAKYLIVNADDYGLCRSANEAVEELFETGKLKSSTVMLTARAAEDAVRFANSHPQYPVGVHLTMTSEWPNYRWKPLTDGKSLVDADGYMWRSSKDVAKNAKLDELEAEIRAQVDLAHAMGMHPSHLDNHMADLKTSYAHYRETILRIWTDIPDGVTETFVHPCVESDEIKSFIGAWRNRVWEYDLLRDPDTHKYLADHGVQMISFRELIEMKRGNT